MKLRRERKKTQTLNKYISFALFISYEHFLIQGCIYETSTLRIKINNHYYFNAPNGTSCALLLFATVTVNLHFHQSA